MFGLKPGKSDDERKNLFPREGKISLIFNLLGFLVCVILFFSPVFNLVCFQFQSLFRSFSPFSEYIYLHQFHKKH